MFVPAGLEAFAVDADFHALFPLEQVQGQAAEPAEVLGPVAFADASLVLAEAHVQIREVFAFGDGFVQNARPSRRRRAGTETS